MNARYTAICSNCDERFQAPGGLTSRALALKMGIHIDAKGHGEYRVLVVSNDWKGK